jgi:hypothetical protein
MMNAYPFANNAARLLVALVAYGVSLPTVLADDTAIASKSTTGDYKTAPQKKSGSGVVVQYRVPGVGSAGVAVPVTLMLSGVYAQDGAKVMVYGEPGMRLSGDIRTTLASKESRSIQVLVTADADGVYYLNVSSTQDGRTSVTAVPIQVGKVKRQLKANGSVQEMPNGERVISMPSAK